MRLEMTGSFDADGSAASSNDLLFLGFHGYSNDESGMVRIINAICATGSPDNTHHANANGNGNVNSNTNRNPAADPPIKPNYISFRGAYTRPYIGSHYWYPDGCSVSERQHECSQVGAEVVCMLQSPVFQRFRKVLIGFSQGGYLSYRMTTEYPDVFDMAVLLSPSFKGETADTIPAGRTRFALCYGSDDRTIPIADQQCAREQLGSIGRCTYFEYPGMAHNICDQEIADVRAWLGL